MFDYYPLKRGMKRRYRSRRPGAAPVEFTLETLSVTSVPGGSSTATIRDTVEGPAGRSGSFEAAKNSVGAFEGSEKVLALPPRVGDSWEAEERGYEIVSVEEVVSTPAGLFAECVKVQYLIAGGDAGSGARYYAPGIGLIKEECADEADPFVTELIQRP